MQNITIDFQDVDNNPESIESVKPIKRIKRGNKTASTSFRIGQENVCLYNINTRQILTIINNLKRMLPRKRGL